MCGIAGFSRAKGDTLNANKLAKALLGGIEERGQDATGAAWLDRHNCLSISKHPVTASLFTQQMSMDKKAQLGILHTRMWTQGSPENALNNHPISSGSLVGVHNGMVMNDYELWRKTDTPRLGEVDSEALFAYLNGEPETQLARLLEDIEASMAIAWIDRNEPGVLRLARGSSSPLVIAQNSAGTLIFASTEDTILDAAKAAGTDVSYMEHIQEGSLLRVVDGVITDAGDFYPVWGISRHQKQKAIAATGGATSKPKTLVSGWEGDLDPMPEYDDFNGDFDDDFEDAPVVTPISRKAIPTEKRWIPTEKLITGTIDLEGSKALETRHPERMRDIDAWIDEAASEFQDDTIWLEAEELGAFYRRGSVVVVHLGGMDPMVGTIYDVPVNFPGGRYTILAELPSGDLAWMSLEYTEFEPSERLPLAGRIAQATQNNIDPKEGK